MIEKGFAPILFILIILVVSGAIVGGSLFYKNNYNKTNGSASAVTSSNTQIKTYVSQQPFFTFNYPSEWNYEIKTGPTLKMSNKSYPSTLIFLNKGEATKYSLLIFYDRDFSNMEVDALAKAYYGSNFIASKKTVIDELNMEEIQYKYQIGDLNKGLAFKKDETFYVLQDMYLHDNVTIYQIAETFKFK